jgi:MYXO-CTERM domain-containing protein
MNMKSLFLSLGTALLTAIGTAQGAVIFTIANFTGSTSGPNGLPIVDSTGIPVAAGGAFASIGYFDSGTVFAGASVSVLLEAFNAVDAAPVGITASRPGLFNGQDYNDAGNVYPAGFQGKQGYIVIGNSANLANSTALAVFSLGSVFSTPAADQTASYTIQLTSAPSSLVYGTLRPMDPGAQPNPLTTTPFTQGVQMVPEPSVALLGLLGVAGLLRRRR